MRNRMRLQWLTVATLISVGAAGLAAQRPGSWGGGMGGGMGGRGGRREGMRGGGERGEPIPTAAELDGAPVPGFMVPRFELDSNQAQQYRQVYDSFMTATAPQRDSAKAARQAIDQAFRARDRQAAREQFPLIRRLGDFLAQQDKRFDDRMKRLLTGDQLKDYRQWRDEERKAEEEERREEMQQRGSWGGSAPHSPS